MAHARSCDAVLGVLDRRIQEAERVAAERIRQERYTEAGIWVAISEELRKTRREILHSVPVRCR